MKPSARIESRVQALEAQTGSGKDYKDAQRFCDNLLEFIVSVFPANPRGCRMDDVAKLCGLPGSRHMKSVIDAAFSEDALQTASMDAYGEDWRDAMKTTLERAVDQVVEVLGDKDIEELSRKFPPVLMARRIVRDGSAETGP